MPEFHWRAADSSGRIEEGRLEAASIQFAARLLKDRGLVPVSVQERGNTIPGEPAARQKASFLSGVLWRRAQQASVNQADLLAVTSELAIMLRAGLNLANALRVLIDMSHKPAVALMLQQILDDVKGGASFSRAIERESQLFGDFYISMVRSGEASGQLAAVLGRLVEHMERVRSLRESVVSAAIYPMILLVVAIVSLVAMLGFVVPQFEKLFLDLGDALPMATRLVMKSGQIFRDWWAGIGLALVSVYWLLSRWMKTPTGKAWVQTKMVALPLLGDLLQKYQLTLFTRTFGTLLGNGVPLLTALKIANRTVSNQVFRIRLDAVVPVVKQGGRLAAALTATGIFQSLALNLIRVGEETGRVGEMMLELATILNRDVETGIRRVLTLLEPLLIIILGVMIASIIVSILLGILAINDLAV